MCASSGDQVYGFYYLLQEGGVTVKKKFLSILSQLLHRTESVMYSATLAFVVRAFKEKWKIKHFSENKYGGFR